MTYQRPALVDLPAEVPETEVWPGLSAALSDENDQIGTRERRWLTVATLHRSALYESRDLSPILSSTCLQLLENVGRAVFSLELRLALHLQNPDWDMPRLHATAARLIGPARRSLVDTLDVASNAQLGAGERQQVTTGRISRSLETVAQQLLGWWSIMQQGQAIRRIARNAIAGHNHPADDTVDWQSLFRTNFETLSPRFSFIQEGPDHAASFVATVTTRDGHSGAGSATRKNEAKRIACRVYIARHAPHLARSATKAAPALDLEYLPINYEHRKLASLFSAADARPISQALTHKSWAYENAGRDRRASNEVLAHLGSGVINACLARTRAYVLLGVSLSPDQDISTPLTLPDEELLPLAEGLNLANSVRLGVGQRQHGVSDEMLANFVQALLAAVWLQEPDFDTFEKKMPTIVSDFLLEHAARSSRDSKTLLQELSVELNFDSSATDEKTGQHHSAIYHNTTSIAAAGDLFVVEGSGPTRRAAGKVAASVAMEAAALSAGATQVPERPDLARFFLYRQLDALGGKRNRWPRWQQRNVLGATYIASRDWTAFTHWLDAVKCAGFDDASVTPAIQRNLAEYYELASQSAPARPRFVKALTLVLRWIQDAMTDDHYIVQAGPYEQLLALAAAHSVWITGDSERLLIELLEDWAFLNRHRAVLEFEVGSQAVVGSQAGAAVLRILHEYASTAPGRNSQLKATLILGQSIHQIQLTAHAGWTADSAHSPVIELVCEAAPGVALVQSGSTTRIEIPSRGHKGSGLLWETAAGARSNDEYEAELGRLLHDLKNEVTAARIAINRPAASRTERREADLAASQHLDSASAIARQLVDAEMLYEIARPGECDLAPFLRGYSSELINRLPPSIRVLPPAITPAKLAINVDVLRSVLDNLVKNAEEAMGDGGELEFSYAIVEEDGVVLLEVRDTGPGLPKDLVAALQTGATVPTSKRHGSGLGLTGAMRILRRAGADLQALKVARGASWLIILPLAKQEETEHE